MALKRITEAQRELMKQKSAQTLPDVPSSKGWTPKHFKNAITKPLFDNENSFYSYINEIVDDIDLNKANADTLKENYYEKNEINNIFLKKNETAADSKLLGGKPPEYYLEYENITGTPQEIKLIIRDTVSSDTVNVAREIQFGSDVWKIEGEGNVDEEVLKNYVKKEEVSTINGTSLLQSNDLTTGDIGINSISSLELEAILK